MQKFIAVEVGAMRGIVQKIILALILFAVIAFGFRYFKQRSRVPEYVRASGMIEVLEVQLAPQAGGRIDKLYIDEGQDVKKGDLVAKLSLDGADDVLASAQAGLASAQAQLAQLRNGFRSEQVSAAKANASAAKIQYDQALRDKNRFDRLAKEGAVAARQAELASEKADAAREAANAAEEQYRLLARGNRAEDIAAAEANVKRLAAEVERAKTGLSYKEFRSPVDGVVLTKNYEEGDVIAAGSPLATVGRNDKCWVKIYIPSSQLGLVRVGQTADVTIDAYPDSVFLGKVTKVNDQAEYNPRLSLTQNERSNMVFWVKVTLDNQEGVLKPGMPADVRLNND